MVRDTVADPLALDHDVAGRYVVMCDADFAESDCRLDQLTFGKTE